MPSVKENNEFSQFTAHFHGDNVIRNVGSADNESGKYRLLTNQRDRVASNDGLPSQVHQEI